MRDRSVRVLEQMPYERMPLLGCSGDDVPGRRYADREPERFPPRGFPITPQADLVAVVNEKPAREELVRPVNRQVIDVTERVVLDAYDDGR